MVKLIENNMECTFSESKTIYKIILIMYTQEISCQMNGYNCGVFIYLVSKIIILIVTTAFIYS